MMKFAGTSYVEIQVVGLNKKPTTKNKEKNNKKITMTLSIKNIGLIKPFNLRSRRDEDEKKERKRQNQISKYILVAPLF